MAKTKTLRCPDCDRALVNRLVDNCLYCGAELPDELTFSKEEKARRREKEMRELEAEEKARLKREAERSKLPGDGGLGDYWTTVGMFGLW